MADRSRRQHAGARFLEGLQQDSPFQFSFSADYTDYADINQRGWSLLGPSEAMPFRCAASL